MTASDFGSNLQKTVTKTNSKLVNVNSSQEMYLHIVIYYVLSPESQSKIKIHEKLQPHPFN